MIHSQNNEIIPHFNGEDNKELNISLFKVNNHDDILIINLSGYIDTYNTQFLLVQINKVFIKYTNIIFNLSGINYISSTGIGAFTQFLKIIKNKNGNMALIRVQSKVYDVFKLLGFINFFNIKDSLESALKIFNVDKVIKKTFPAIIICPVCDKKLKAPRAGKFRCPKCKQILIINKKIEISLV